MKCFLVLLLITLPRLALAQAGLILLDDAPPQPVTPMEPSLGQQPFPVYREPDLTSSQTNSNQLNQLFEFETTPDTCAAGEGYITGNFDYTRLSGSNDQYRYQLQGQYGFTDQIAAGAFVPVVTTHIGSTSTGMGDVGFYGQYKFDQFINPEIFDLTAQLDVILPTGSQSAMRDTGRFGIRPLALAYKDFGQHGPGIFGLYGLFGGTLTTKSDLRLGVAATYQYDDLVGVFEFFDIVNNRGRSLALVTPGISYRGISPWEFSLGVPMGISQGTPDWGIIFKLTYVFQN